MVGLWLLLFIHESQGLSKLEKDLFNDACVPKTDEDFKILEKFIVPHEDRPDFFINNPATNNQLKTKFNGRSYAKSNGYCDIGTFDSWQSCSEVGECYEDCWDGKCHEFKKNGTTPFPKNFSEDGKCREKMLLCAKQCADNPECDAFSFLMLEKSSYYQVFRCNLMAGGLCKPSTIDPIPPRSVYHVKRSFYETLKPEQIENDDSLQQFWTSWSQCQTKAKCGEGVENRWRRKEDGGKQWNARKCHQMTSTGEPIPCPEEVVLPEIAHGLTQWSEWGSCSKTCFDPTRKTFTEKGTRLRTRSCGTCQNPDLSNLCENPSRLLFSEEKEGQNLPYCEGEKVELEECNVHQCLPHSNLGWAEDGKTRDYYKVEGWATAPENSETDFAQFQGKCPDFATDAYKSVLINGDTRRNLNEKINRKRKAAFAECMKLCRDESGKCKAVTFKPEFDSVSGSPNCFLHETRCHESSDFTTDDAQVWYAYKNHCFAKNFCAHAGDNWRSKCDASGEFAYPNLPKCSCQGSADKHTSGRFFGNALGWREFNETTNMYQPRIPAPKFYNEKQYSRIFNNEATTEQYLQTYEDNLLMCHNPCAHHRCGENSICELDGAETTGYRCNCKHPYIINPAFDYNFNACIQNIDNRNVRADFSDSKILFGGGWHRQPPPGFKINDEPMPSDRYYGLESTDEPGTVQIVHLNNHAPSPTREQRIGKFYGCMMHLDSKSVMLAGGKWGDSFNQYDDQTSVFRFNELVSDGKWIDTQGNEMQSSPESCQGENGCVRGNDWPDLPSTSVLRCEGQCRNGEAGVGPTNVHWIAEYCYIKAEFINSESWKMEEMEFNLCEYKLVRDEEDGEFVPKLGGKYKSEKQEEAVWRSNVANYQSTFLSTAGEKFRGKLNRIKWSENEDVTNNRTTEHVWKDYPSPELFSPAVGPQDPVKKFYRGSDFIDVLIKEARSNNAQGQPVCGILGDRAYLGSGTGGFLYSIPRNPDQLSTEPVWRRENSSRFPQAYSRIDGRRCTARRIPTQYVYDLFPIQRQSLGIASTTEGLWMLGGLVHPSADVENTIGNIKYADVAGCTKGAMYSDVWVFNPRGWNRQAVLGDAAEKYKGQSAKQILPERYSFGDGQDEKLFPQSFEDFTLWDEESSDNALTIQRAEEEGWECSAVQGGWCRKPFLPHHTKAPEVVTLCFEYDEGEEIYQPEYVDVFGNTYWGKPKRTQKRPRVCTIEETKNDDNDCICYLFAVGGQAGRKNAPNMSGFRREVFYLEIRRADGTYGSDRPKYSSSVSENCPNAQKLHAEDADLVVDETSAVADFSECTDSCTNETCNRKWDKTLLRRKWHEAGRIRFPRLGFLSGTLKGEIFLWGGECAGFSKDDGKSANMELNGTCRSCYKTHLCKAKIDENGVADNQDYMERFVIFRMNKAGFLFGAPRNVEMKGWYPGTVTNDESQVSQQFSAINNNNAFYS